MEINDLILKKDKKETKKVISDMYHHTKANKNNLSYWFPKIKGHKCKELKIPYTFVTDVPVHIFKSFYMDRYEEDTETIYEWVKNELIPKLPERLKGLIFIKNGCYSDKFQFMNCATRCDPLSLTRAICEINYNSHLVGAGGSTEVVIRERLLTDERIVPTIYNGLPLQPEFRVFYDFDERKVLYVANYWDWEYCADNINRNATDRLVYTLEYNNILTTYEKYKDKVTEMIEETMKDVKLTGTWSVDVLLNQINNEFWLIDMAVAEQSAYWNEEKK